MKLNLREWAFAVAFSVGAAAGCTCDPTNYQQQQYACVADEDCATGRACVAGVCTDADGGATGGGAGEAPEAAPAAAPVGAAAPETVERAGARAAASSSTRESPARARADPATPMATGWPT